MKYTYFIYIGFSLILLGSILLIFGTENMDSILIIFPFIITTDNNPLIIIITFSIAIFIPLLIMLNIFNFNNEQKYKKCPKCKAISVRDASFCWNCGYKFDDENDEHINSESNN